jgi:hypothetical protein
VPPGHVGLRPQRGLDDEQRQHAPAFGRRRQRGMIDDPQVALEPEDHRIVHARRHSQTTAPGKPA